MKRPGFEADRYWIEVRDLKSGETHEIASAWDRSPESLQWSADGKTLTRDVTVQPASSMSGDPIHVVFVYDRR